MNINTKYFSELPTDAKISMHTDIGNDPDDALALYLLIKAQQQNIISPKSLNEVVTTLFRPEQKAEIAAKICNFMKDIAIPIHPGFGNDPKTSQEFTASFPFWPSVWGIPGFTNSVSLGQGKGYDSLSFHAEQISNKYNIEEAQNNFDVVLGLAPYTDLAKISEKCDKINRIILMGGYFGKETEGKIEISRAGYNTAIDPDASEKILTQSKHPILIFNSQHITNWKFSWMQDEILAILCSNEKNALGHAIAKDLAHYWSTKKPSPYGSLVMADVLTVYAGVIHPELIKSTMPVEFHFSDKYYNNQETHLKEPIHMMHPQAKTLFTVSKKEMSNIHIVTEFTKDPELLRKQVVEEIVVPLFFSSKESFYKAVEEQRLKSLSNDQIGSLLLQLYPKEV